MWENLKALVENGVAKSITVPLYYCDGDLSEGELIPVDVPLDRVYGIKPLIDEYADGRGDAVRKTKIPELEASGPEGKALAHLWIYLADISENWDEFLLRLDEDIIEGLTDYILNLSEEE